MHLWWKTYLFRFQKYRRLSVPPECVSWIASQSNRGSLSVSTYSMPHSIVNCTNMSLWWSQHISTMPIWIVIKVVKSFWQKIRLRFKSFKTHQYRVLWLQIPNALFLEFKNSTLILIMTWKQILSWTDNRRDNLVMRLQFLCWFFFVDWTLDYLSGIIYPSLDHQRKWSVDYI